MIQLVGFFGRFLDPLLKTGLPLIKNVIKGLAKSALFPLRLTAAVLVAYEDSCLLLKEVSEAIQNDAE